MSNIKKLLSQDEIIGLKEALSHMKVSELKNQLEILKLSSKAFNKKELIDRLINYAETGKELSPLKIPAVSKAHPSTSYFLSPDTPMLYGSYKNNLAAREFFKKLIGKHFYFTAQGIDWLRERWLEGNPPTYAEFAKEWQDEYERNKKQKRAPKQEWAYIRFVQKYMEQFPTDNKLAVNNAWEARRQENIKKVQTIFKKI